MQWQNRMMKGVNGVKRIVLAIDVSIKYGSSEL